MRGDRIYKARCDHASIWVLTDEDPPFLDHQCPVGCPLRLYPDYPPGGGLRPPDPRPL